MKIRTVTAVLGVLAVLGALAPVLHGAAPKVGRATVAFNGKPAPAASASASGFSVVAGADGPQLALFGGGLLLALRQGEQVDIRIPLTGVPGEFTLAAEATLVSGAGADVELALDGAQPCRAALAGKTVRLTVTGGVNGKPTTARLRTVCRGGRVAVRWNAAFRRWPSPRRPPAGLNGWAKTVRAPESRGYNSGMFGVLRSRLVRQTDGQGAVVWRTKALRKEDVQAGGEAQFRWQASTGWVTEPGGGHFTLFLDGRKVLTFDLAMKSKTWRSADRRFSLAYEVMGFTRPDRQDSVGIMTLTAPAGAVKVGQSVEIKVTGSASKSRRFFMLYEAARVTAGPDAKTVRVTPAAVHPQACPPPVLPALRPAIEQALIEWDWRMQDGIGTPRAPVPHADAIRRAFQRGDRLLEALKAGGVPLEQEAAGWERLRRRFDKLRAGPETPPERWEALWRDVHVLRRRIVFRNPLARTGPLVFVKKVPSIFSHQITQYQGSTSRPGGGLFVLEEPGRSMRSRQLASELPMGSTQHADVSYDGRRVLFAHCAVKKTPPNRVAHRNHFYHLYEINADGSGLRRLTDGPFDDLAPRYLPDGRIVFISTRRGGFHRCGLGPCPAHTLALAEADGSNPRTVSYHETHEWDPAVLNNGRVIYTRWDYVDRDAKYYQQLWSVRPDGSGVQSVYGNNTFNPVGIWEARAVPGSNRVIATAAAHHAMTAGSIVLVDVTRGVDGLKPITRLTPDALFPESETVVFPGWRAPDGVRRPPPVPVEMQRWPGHSYRSPYALSEDLFLAAYSFDPLIGEPHPNRPNMFGLYLVDRFGNKELIYRDVSISSLWPMPLRPRRRPPVVPSITEPAARPEGTFVLQNVHVARPALPKEEIRRLRIVQVLPKTTPHADTPPVGLARAAPGKQVLGTVPVERDGSAHFTAPSGVQLAFQALDARGRAVQIMRSEVYLQPGETVSCIGCHEPRTMAPPKGAMPLAAQRLPSKITPGPDGSKPFSYPILVQPVLDKHCLRCHDPKTRKGKVVLTGKPQGRYSVSYNALAPRVPYSEWSPSGPAHNCEPTTRPGRFGARGSRLMKRLLAGHGKVKLSAEDIERLVTWMDANALFYGTFDPADQKRQQRGERIEGPKLE